MNESPKTGNEEVNWMDMNHKSDEEKAKIPAALQPSGSTATPLNANKKHPQLLKTKERFKGWTSHCGIQN
jgi:hypothetical protein